MLSEVGGWASVRTVSSGGGGAMGVDDRIRAAYAALVAEPGGWVGLRRLREALADIPRDTLDDALRALARTDGVDLVPEDNQKTLTAADRAASIRHGGQDKHLFSIEEPHVTRPAAWAGAEARVLGAMRVAASREEAAAQLAGAGRAELAALCAAAGIRVLSRHTRADLASRLVDATVGFRVEHEALGRQAVGGQAPPRQAAAGVEARVVAAYRRLAGGGAEWVRITRLRRVLADIPRAELDAALLRMERARPSHALLAPDEDQKSLTAADRESAVRVGDTYNHLLWVNLAGLAASRAAPEPAAPPAGPPRHKKLLGLIEALKGGASGGEALAPALARVVRIAQDAGRDPYGSAADLAADILRAVAEELPD